MQYNLLRRKSRQYNGTRKVITFHLIRLYQNKTIINNTLDFFFTTKVTQLRQKQPLFKLYWDVMLAAN